MTKSLFPFYQFVSIFSLSFGKKVSVNTPKLFANSETEIRVLGWALLVIWIITIVYMTRDFFFPTLFSPMVLQSTLSLAEIQKYSHLNTVVEENEGSVSDTVASDTIVRHRHSG